ncbi:MAG: hypothetical protein ABR915_14590 [Thermoguttaceae bacterium]
MRTHPFWLSLVLILAVATPAMAAVDLLTLPTREGTQLTIYNSEDITMVREHRLLTVKEGVNRIQFSWANTLIDPTSIEFRILDHQDKVDLVDTTFPSGRNDALQWNIKSQMAGKIPVEIRYFTSGITWSADYVGIANEDETKLNLTGYVRVANNSGELYDNAQTRLVVGTIVRRLKDQQTTNVVARQYKRRLDDQFVLYYDLVDYDETFFYEEEIVSGKPVVAKTELERRFDANVVLWGEGQPPKDWNSNEPGAYVDLHNIPGRVERVDQNHVKYFLNLPPGKKQVVNYSATYKRRKAGPELNTERKREPL